jgi:hypothetical protein
VESGSQKVSPTFEPPRSDRVSSTPLEPSVAAPTYFCLPDDCASPKMLRDAELLQQGNDRAPLPSPSESRLLRHVHQYDAACGAGPEQTALERSAIERGF